MGKHPAWLGKAMQSGGRAPGELDEKEQQKYLREKSRNSAGEAARNALQTAVFGVGAGAGLLKSKVGKLGVSGLGAWSGSDLVKNATDAKRYKDEADTFDEGRKRGGRASKKKG